MPLELNYLSAPEFETYQTRAGGRILGAMAFGRAPHVTLKYPGVAVDLPLLKGDTVYEVWTGDEPVVYDNSPDFLSARNGDFLFGCLQTEAGEALEAAAHRAYCRIFDFIDRHRYDYLLRVWHYFPQINATIAGLERYKQFNVGRHGAFVAKGRDVEDDAPAASAVGSRSGPLVIYFLAAPRAGQPIENPRQKSAYHYPAEYGPCSPTFSRAMFMQTQKTSLLFISGTASIVGDETRHVDQPREQIMETIANLRAVMEQAQFAGWNPSRRENALLLKVYLRKKAHLPIAQQLVAKTFGPQARAVYFQAEICRSNLLLEIEATCQGECLT